jgi:hypothetical protein
MESTERTVRPPGSSGRSERWYFNAAADLLLGCGVGYFVLFASFAFFGNEMQAVLPLGLLPLVVLVTGVPHYGATLVRVCERPEDRRAYAFVTIGASVATIAALAAGMQSAWFGSWLLTVYLTWSPWHYSGQNFGIAMMFLRRRGVGVTPLARRLLHASFVLSFVLIALSIHGAAPGSDYAPVEYAGTLYGQISLGIPEFIRAPMVITVACAYALCLLGSGVLLLRAGTFRDLIPAAAVAASQCVWFALPAIARFGDWFQDAGPLAAAHNVYIFAWIGAAHSVQYLWVTSYFAKRSSRGDDAATTRTFLLRYGALVLTAGAALWVVPALVFAPGALGDLPFDAGLAVMIAAAVNIHHFILDGVIWKLRNARIAGILIRSRAAAEEPSLPQGVAPKRRSAAALLVPAAWLLGFACVGIHFLGTIEYEVGLRQALVRGDVERAQVAVDRLRRIGRDSAKIRLTAGLAQANAGDLAGGIDSLTRGVELLETAEGWGGLGSLYERAGRVDAAVGAYRNAQALGPESPELMNNLAWLLATRRSDDPAAVAEAVTLARRASQSFGDTNPAALDTLAVAYAASGNFRDARRAARRALDLARAAGDEATAAEVAERLALYRAGRPWRETTRPE